MSEENEGTAGAADSASATETSGSDCLISADAETTEQPEPMVDRPDPEDFELARHKHRFNWPKVLAFGILPGAALLLAMVAGFLRWQDSSGRESEIARSEAVAAAKESTVALLSYQPDTVEKSVAAARDRLTAAFKETYTKLTHDVVIPGAKQEHVSVTVTVPEAAWVSATPRDAVALLFVDQSAVVGTKPPITTVSSIRVTLQKASGHWLISGFDPV